MIKSKSSHIESFEYNEATNTLEIKFRNTKDVYQYANVTQKAYHAFKDAESHGKYFAKNVNGKYKHKIKPTKKGK